MYLDLETKKYNYIPKDSIFIDDYDKYLIPSKSKRPIMFVQRELFVQYGQKSLLQ